MRGVEQADLDVLVWRDVIGELNAHALERRSPGEASLRSPTGSTARRSRGTRRRRRTSRAEELAVGLRRHRRDAIDHRAREGDVIGDCSEQARRFSRRRRCGARSRRLAAFASGCRTRAQSRARVRGSAVPLEPSRQVAVDGLRGALRASRDRERPPRCSRSSSPVASAMQCPPSVSREGETIRVEARGQRLEDGLRLVRAAGAAARSNRPRAPRPSRRYVRGACRARLARSTPGATARRSAEFRARLDPPVERP